MAFDGIVASGVVWELSGLLTDDSRDAAATNKHAITDIRDVC